MKTTTYDRYTHRGRYVESTGPYVLSSNVLYYSLCYPVKPLRVGSIPPFDVFAYAKSRISWVDGELDLEVKRILDEAKDKLGLLSLSYIS